MMFSDTEARRTARRPGTARRCGPECSRSALPCSLLVSVPEDLDGALGRLVEADDGAQQHRFAGSRTAHKPDNFAAKYVEIEVVVDDVVAELGAHAAQLEHDVAAVSVVDQLSAFRPWLGCGTAFAPRQIVFRHQTFASRKMIEKIASSTMTQKIDSTTERVVSWPTLSALPWTCSPSKQPIVAITAPNTGALIMPV